MYLCKKCHEISHLTESVCLSFNAHLSHKGCKCKEGWEGAHCEYKAGEAPYYSRSPNALGISLGITTSIIVITVGGILLWKRKKGSKESPQFKSPELGGVPSTPV